MAKKLKDRLREGVVVYGPYIRKDGRKHVILYDGKYRQTMSYPKWLKEQEIGRFFQEDETVDHYDRDFTNDILSNLVVRIRSDHQKLDVVRAELITLKCIWCSKELVRRRRHVRGNAKQKSAGPFCKHCAGKYGAMLQNGQIDELPPQRKVKLKHYQLDKSAGRDGEIGSTRGS